MLLSRRTACLYGAASLLVSASGQSLAQSAGGADLSSEELGALARDLFRINAQFRKEALAKIKARGNPDMTAPLIQTLRFFREDPGIGSTLFALTGENLGNDWHAWMQWQQVHPEIVPFEGFDSFKADLMAQIDPNFRLFLSPGIKHEIRLEEITWGGVVKDGIPALVNPTHITPAEATYITEDELVFGVAINGDVRAYPLRMMDWHEMFNDVVGGVPLALAYCTLCASGILFETQLEGREDPIIFGSSGFLYRSNKLMYDKKTNSLWNQFTGRPVVGELTGSGVELKVRPVAITTWKKWLDRHPDTKVLSLDTGFQRDYAPGRPYGEYFASSELMFPVNVGNKSLAAKDYVFALREAGYDKAWSLASFEKEPVINDSVGDLDLVLVGDPASRTVRAYRSGGRKFQGKDARADLLVADNTIWKVEEERLLSESGEELQRLPGHIAYWFAWSGYKPDQPYAVQ